MGLLKNLVNSLEHGSQAGQLKKLVEAFFYHEYQITLAFFKVRQDLERIKNASKQFEMMQTIIFEVEGILRDKEKRQALDSFYNSGLNIKNFGPITVRRALAEFYASIQRVQTLLQKDIFVGLE